MTTVEVAQELRRHGFSFRGGQRLETATRAWLIGEPCFFEVERGRWALGYHAAPLPAERRRG